MNSNFWILAFNCIKYQLIKNKQCFWFLLFFTGNSYAGTWFGNYCIGWVDNDTCPLISPYDPLAPTRFFLCQNNATYCHQWYTGTADELCPAPELDWSNEASSCVPVNPLIIAKNLGACPLGACSFDMMTGNPVNTGTGNKYQVETDYTGSGPFPLSFKRYYNSDVGALTSRIGTQWRHSYDRVVKVIDPTTVAVVMADGKTYQFTLNAGQWTPDADVVDRLEELTDGPGGTLGWRYTRADDAVEDYDASGRLLAITRSGGLVHTLNYDVPLVHGGDDDPATLDTVTDPFGRMLSLSYDANGRIATLTDPAGAVYAYTYDVSGNLATAGYPGESPDTRADNPIRIYHYEDSNHPHALTGITDETGSRYASWAYDSEGRATMSEHAQGAERVDIVYHPDRSATVTDSLGDSRTYHFTVLHGVARATQIDGAGPCAGCAGQSQALTYDANGFITSRTDFNGNVTTYVYDDRGLEISRTEAAGTPEARIITTEWHPDYRLPIRITAPDKVTTFTYDTQGRLLVRKAEGVQ
jgi:YD repeat-containing protein